MSMVANISYTLHTRCVSIQGALDLQLHLRLLPWKELPSLVGSNNGSVEPRFHPVVMTSFGPIAAKKQYSDDIELHLKSPIYELQ